LPNGYNGLEKRLFKGDKNVAPAKPKQFIYIVQAAQEVSFCKIGKTNDLERRLKEYNNMTGKSKSNDCQFVFSCEVKDMAKVENDITKKFSSLREKKGKEIYFFNDDLFDDYVKFIKGHKLFVKEVFIKVSGKRQIVKIVKKTTPSLEERGVTFKKVMLKAQKVNDDEFFTRYEDVEKELSMYSKSVWKNKTVFCNCDDAVDNDERKTSAFSLYFLRNFNKLELKKLICTHYDGPVDLFNQGPKGYVFTKEGFEEIYDTPLGFTGSFDDPLSLKILKEDADIVCTNPPFSKAMEFWDVTVKSRKKFLVISNIAVVLTTAYFKYFKDKKAWAGYNEVDWFLTPKRELTRAAGFWFTNIPIKNRPRYKQLKIMPLKHIPEKYIKYDDAKMLLVDNCYIPSDYKKPFAVSARPILNGLLEKGYKLTQDKEYRLYINGKEAFSRVLVQKI
jgi:predicted GIY-YIG superfamily endonuclease